MSDAYYRELSLMAGHLLSSLSTIGETSLLSPSQTPTNLQNAAVVFIHGSGILSQGVDLIRQGKCYDRSGETIM